MEKGFPSKWTTKTVRNNYTYIWQNRLQNKIRRDNEGHFILIKEKYHQGEISILTINTPKIGALNNFKKTLKELKIQIDPNTVTMRDTYTHCHQYMEYSGKKWTHARLNGRNSHLKCISPKHYAINLFFRSSWRFL
jgi:hypothetical protein